MVIPGPVILPLGGSLAVPGAAMMPGMCLPMLLLREVIHAKRDGKELSTGAIHSFIAGVTDGSVTDAQVGAFAMAVYYNGMDPDEQAALTLAMRDSGSVLQWTDLDGPVLDKHSTGGVGDLVSLVLGPAVAACGGYVPHISGRGLGHTGGTLDKLESIPGFSVQQELDPFRRIVREAGIAIVGQSPDLAPADRRLYAVRDVTGTVGSVPLIVSSILSKKLSEGLDGLVMDIKAGNGAFMSDPSEAGELAVTITGVAAQSGLRCTGLVTDMNQPLAGCAGNALELAEAIDILNGQQHSTRLLEVIISLGGEMVLLGGLEETLENARRRVLAALDSGAAAERFARMVHLQGGPADLLDRPRDYLPKAPVILPFRATSDGHVGSIDTRLAGVCVLELGGGRKDVKDTIDHRVGLSGLCSVGEKVSKGQPLAVVHAATKSDWERATDCLSRVFRLQAEPLNPLPVIQDRVIWEKS